MMIKHGFSYNELTEMSLKSLTFWAQAVYEFYQKQLETET